jgi:uncharacterized protein YidB (DUF937 family)
MGLLDVLNGMRNGPGGQSGSAPASSGGMSPITMAILALLAYKGIKHLSAGQGQTQAPAGNAAAPSGGLGDVLGGLLGGAGGAGGAGGLGGLLQGAGGAGGLGGLLQGGLLQGGLGGALGNVLAGGAAGSVLSGGLGDLLKQFQQNGHGEAASSWVGDGPNKELSESDLAKSIGADDLDAIAKHVGMSRDQLLAGLKRELPGAVDELTPDGRVPTGDEINRRV